MKYREEMEALVNRGAELYIPAPQIMLLVGAWLYTGNSIMWSYLFPENEFAFHRMKVFNVKKFNDSNYLLSVEIVETKSDAYLSLVDAFDEDKIKILRKWNKYKKSECWQEVLETVRRRIKKKLM
jgi:hypothetical protein